MIFLFARNACGLFTFLTNLKTVNWNDDRYTHLRYQISYSSTPLSFLLIQANIETHSDKGRCSALNGSKVTESSFRHNGKSHNLKKTSAGFWEKILERERWWSCLTSVFIGLGGGGGNNSGTLMEKWCELSFLLYSPGLLYFSEDSNSHQSFPSAPFDAARFKEKQEGLLRHSMVQSRVSYTAYVPILGTFK